MLKILSVQAAVVSCILQFQAGFHEYLEQGPHGAGAHRHGIDQACGHVAVDVGASMSGPDVGVTVDKIQPAILA